MTAPDLIARCRSLRVELTAAGDKLRLRAPEGVLTPALRAELRDRKAEVIAALLATCPRCGRPLDRRVCWKCFDRLCEGCGQMTGTACVRNCVICGLHLPDQE